MMMRWLPMRLLMLNPVHGMLMRPKSVLMLLLRLMSVLIIIVILIIVIITVVRS